MMRKINYTNFNSSWDTSSIPELKGRVLPPYRWPNDSPNEKPLLTKNVPYTIVYTPDRTIYAIKDKETKEIITEWMTRDNIMRLLFKKHRKYWCHLLNEIF